MRFTSGWKYHLHLNKIDRYQIKKLTRKKIAINSKITHSYELLSYKNLPCHIWLKFATSESLLYCHSFFLFHRNFRNKLNTNNWRHILISHKNLSPSHTNHLSSYPKYCNILCDMSPNGAKKREMEYFI